MPGDMPYGFRDRVTRATLIKDGPDGPARQSLAVQHKRRTLTSRGCHFVWASDDSVTDSDSESDVERPAKRRRVTKPVNTKARVHFKRENSDKESSSEGKTGSEESSSEESEESSEGDQSVFINGSLHSFYDRYRQVFTMPGLEDGVNDDGTQRDERQTPLTEGSESAVRDTVGGEKFSNGQNFDVEGRETNQNSTDISSEEDSTTPSEEEKEDDAVPDEPPKTQTEGSESGLRAMVLYQRAEEAQDLNAVEKQLNDFSRIQERTEADPEGISNQEDHTRPANERQSAKTEGSESGEAGMAEVQGAGEVQKGDGVEHYLD